MHVLVDTSLYQQRLGVKAFVNVRTLVAENLLQVQTSAAEKSGISQLMQAKKEAAIDSIDGFNLGLKDLLGLFRRIQEYVKAVQDGKVQGDLAVGRGLTAQLCSEPVIATEAIENLCKTSLQDSLMVVYLSNLTRTQISMTEKIQAMYGDVIPPQRDYERRDYGDRDRSKGYGDGKGYGDNRGYNDGKSYGNY